MTTFSSKSRPKPAHVDYRDVVRPADDTADSNLSAAPLSDLSLVALRNIRMMHLLERVATKFNEAGVPVMALKGAALSLTVYDQCDERSMVDLDLMVEPAMLDQATGLLEEMGCLRNQVLMREDFFPRFYYEIEYRSGDIDPVIIDLHVRPFRPLRYARTLPEDAFWGRARPVQIGSAVVLVPGVEDMLIHLATHSAIHGNKESKWLKDIKRWVETHQEQMNWSSLIDTARRWHLTLPVFNAIAATEQFYVTRLCSSGTKNQMVQSPANWRDWIALWQAPRDNDHPVAHVLVNALCTPGWRFVLGYLWAALFPDRSHMEEWYGHRHRAWLPCAHMLRWIWPIVGRSQRIWSRFTKIEVRKSPTHGNGVFATRDIPAGQLIARYRQKPVDRDGTYVIAHSTAPDGTIQYYAIMGKLRCLNHNCKANAELSNLKLVALQPISRDQEITIDYGVDACYCRQNRRIKTASRDGGP